MERSPPAPGTGRPGPVVTRRVVRDGAEALDELAVEEPLEIRVDGDAVAVTLRTPGRDADLALGFLFAEGIVAGPEDVGAATHCGRPGDEGYGNVLDVRSAGGVTIDPDRILEGKRFLPVGSACGVCGRRSIDQVLLRVPKVAPGAPVPRALVRAAMEALHRSQPVFARTGGLHGALAVDRGGAPLASAEDIGRHNAVDKVVGALLRAGRVGPRAPAEGRPAVLAVSGRAGFEIIQKAAMAGIPVVASVSAPSSLAADLAIEAGVTLLGFVRGERMNAYAHEERLAD